MNFKYYILINVVVLIFFFNTKPAVAQKMTRVRGTVVDAKTKEPLPFVNVIFVGKNIGTITDYNGKYSIETQWPSSKLEASFLGYKKQYKNIIKEKNQVVNFRLEANTIILDEAVVVSKKKRYRNKNNPAVELIEKNI